MSCHWPKGIRFKPVVLDVLARDCPECNRRMHVCDHRHHHVYSFDGPLKLINRLVSCPDSECPAFRRTFSPEVEYTITMPWWSIDWQVFTWIGHRRFARHWSVPQIREELSDTHDIVLSEDAIENSIRQYQIMLAAREQDPKVLAHAYRDVKDLVLSIDGLQPEKGHETLYVVRELRAKRVWFAESLISSSAAEVRRLLVQARQWAERLQLPVSLWVSDKQDAFVTGIAAEFPGIGHRYCSNHFLRDLAKPVLEEDSHAKVKMRKKVRGLRAIEREILKKTSQTSDAPQQTSSAAPEQPEDVALDYCTAVRGILNNDQGGPLNPPGIRMADSLQQVRDSLQRNLDAKKGASLTNASNG